MASFHEVNIKSGYRCGLCSDIPDDENTLFVIWSDGQSGFYHYDCLLKRKKEWFKNPDDVLYIMGNRALEFQQAIKMDGTKHTQ